MDKKITHEVPGIWEGTRRRWVGGAVWAPRRGRRGDPRSSGGANSTEGGLSDKKKIDASLI